MPTRRVSDPYERSRACQFNIFCKAQLNIFIETARYKFQFIIIYYYYYYYYYCLGYRCVRDMSPKSTASKGLGESRTGTRQDYAYGAPL